MTISFSSQPASLRLAPTAFRKGSCSAKKRTGTGQNCLLSLSHTLSLALSRSFLLSCSHLLSLTLSACCYALSLDVTVAKTRGDSEGTSACVHPELSYSLREGAWARGQKSARKKSCPSPFLTQTCIPSRARKPLPFPGDR